MEDSMKEMVAWREDGRIELCEVEGLMFRYYTSWGESYDQDVLEHLARRAGARYVHVCDRDAYDSADYDATIAWWPLNRSDWTL